MLFCLRVARLQQRGSAMQAGSLAGLLHAGPAAASPADTPPSFDVEEKMSLEGGVVWYNVVLREPAKLTRKIVRVRWSQMEALSKALHSAEGMPGFPDSVYVERKFFKTSDPDKLESRRLEVKVRAASLASATTTAVAPPTRRHILQKRRQPDGFLAAGVEFGRCSSSR